MNRNEIQIYRRGCRDMAEECRKLALKLADDADDRIDHGLARSILELCADKIGKLKFPKPRTP